MGKPALIMSFSDNPDAMFSFSCYLWYFFSTLDGFGIFIVFRGKRIRNMRSYWRS